MKLLTIVGWLLVIFGAIFEIGWYTSWLNEHFLWRYFADLIGLITAPLIPVAVLIEWLWHGWPTDITLSFLSFVVGALVLIVSGIAKEKALRK